MYCAEALSLLSTFSTSEIRQCHSDDHYHRCKSDVVSSFFHFVLGTWSSALLGLLPLLWCYSTAHVQWLRHSRPFLKYYVIVNNLLVVVIIFVATTISEKWCAVDQSWGIYELHRVTGTKVTFVRHSCHSATDPRLTKYSPFGHHLHALILSRHFNIRTYHWRRKRLVDKLTAEKSVCFLVGMISTNSLVLV